MDYEQEILFEAICGEMEHSLGRSLTEAERTSLRLAHAATKPTTPFLVDRRSQVRKPKPSTPQNSD